jgi:CDP-diacylglycerol--glycerol-3-phosphate 3-phosphatidyltransferase
LRAFSFFAPLPGWDLEVELIARTAMWFMVGISLISAFDYFAGFWRKIDHSARRSRKRRTFILSRRRKTAGAVGSSPERP